MNLFCCCSKIKYPKGFSIYFSDSSVVFAVRINSTEKNNFSLVVFSEWKFSSRYTTQGKCNVYMARSTHKNVVKIRVSYFLVASTAVGETWSSRRYAKSKENINFNC